MRNGESLPQLEDYDATALSRAQTQWLFGEWHTLAAVGLESLHHHPDRDRFALLVAAAQQQLGRHDEALKAARMALSWGCRPKLVAQVLVAGVHNSLGRAAALARNDVKAARHFQLSVVTGETRSEATAFMGHARSVREITKLGLLPQAANLIDASLAAASGYSERPEVSRARIKSLEAELELVRGSLLQAVSRKRIYTPEHRDPPESPEAGRPDEEVSTSQLGQDLWVLGKLGHKRDGYFVEFGATDGVLLSNTWLLEQRYGWRGICAEPHPGFFEQLCRNRRCVTTPACIDAVSGREVDFILADEYGGIAAHAFQDAHSDKRAAFQSLGKVVRLPTTSLHDLLVRHGAPRDIDYLSIDTEGSEYEILRAFPWEKWNIRCITVEHNHSALREPIQRLLAAQGYARTEAQWDDWYFRPGGSP